MSYVCRGAESALHVIVFDELDSIARERGSFSGDGTGVRDRYVESYVQRTYLLLDYLLSTLVG